MKYPFLHERRHNLSVTQSFIYFSSIRIQLWVTAQSLEVYKQFFDIRIFCKWKTGVYSEKITVSMSNYAAHNAVIIDFHEDDS